MPHSEEAVALANKLERELTRYGLQPGWRFPPEERLAEMHAVSRSAVRAALAVLRERGLVSSRRGGGNFVTTVDADAVAGALRGYVARTETDKSFDELLHLRMLVEGECARELATKRRKEALIRLQENYAEMKRHVEDPTAFAKADYEFHRTLVNECGNGLFRAIMNALSDFFARYQKHSHTIVANRVSRVLAEHEAILEAIEQGDADAAAHLASAHVQRAKANLKAAGKAA